jgi:predicted nucleic acid-binding protein
MDLLADANWLIRLEREMVGKPGPAMALVKKSRVFVNTIAHAEFLSGSSPRVEILKRFVQLPMITYREAGLAGALRRRQARIGKTMSTPDALMAADALSHQLRLLTADKDFSGIPGLSWSAYRT